MKDTLTKAIIYLRVSSGPQEKGTSLDGQLSSCRKKCEETGAIIVGWEQDVQSGASYDTRLGLQKALKRIETGEANLLVAYDPSRVSRDVGDQQDIVKRLKRVKANLLLCTMHVGNLSTAQERLNFNVTTVFGAFEREQMQERTRGGAANRAHRGIQPQRSRSPYGYMLVNQNHVDERLAQKSDIGTYIVTEPQARWVQTMFAMYLEGASLYKITQHFNGQGIPTPRGSAAWSSTVIRKILMNSVYKGKATYGRTKRVKDTTRTERGVKEIYAEESAPEEIIYIDCPPLVSEEQWREVQKRLKENRTLRAGAPGRKYMLSGILRCPLCGSKIFGRTRIHPESALQYYLCQFAGADGRHKRICDGRHYPVESLDRQVSQYIIEVAGNPLLIAEHLRKKEDLTSQGAADLETTEKNIKKSLQAIQSRRDALIEAQISAISKGIDPEIYQGKLRDAEVTRLSLSKELEEIESRRRQQAPERIAALSERIAETLADFQIVFESPLTKNSEKHDLLTHIIESITPEHKPPRFRGPVAFEVKWREDII